MLLNFVFSRKLYHLCYSNDVFWQASLSLEAEKVLEETIQDKTKGDVIYFWVRLNMDGATGSNDVLTFWSMCDILNGGHCRHVFSSSCT